MSTIDESVNHNWNANPIEPSRSKMNNTKTAEFDEAISTRLDYLASSRPTSVDRLAPATETMSNFFSLHQMHVHLYEQYRQSANAFTNLAEAEKVQAQRDFGDTREKLLESNIDLNKPDDALAWINRGLEKCDGDDGSIEADLSRPSNMTRLQLLRTKVLLTRFITFKVNEAWNDEADADAKDFGSSQLFYQDNQKVQKERGQSNEKLRRKADYTRRELFQPKKLVVDLGEFEIIGDGQPKDTKATKHAHQVPQKSKSVAKERGGYFENWEGLVISLVAPLVVFSIAAWLVYELPRI